MEQPVFSEMDEFIEKHNLQDTDLNLQQFQDAAKVDNWT